MDIELARNNIRRLRIDAGWNGTRQADRKRPLRRGRFRQRQRESVIRIMHREIAGCHSVEETPDRGRSPRKR
jgi:hypothetical protein